MTPETPETRRSRSRTAPVARHGRLPRRSTTAGILKFLGAALAVVLVSTLGVAAVAVASITSQIRPGIDLVGDGGTIPDIGAIEGGVNLLLVGSDSGEGDAAYGKRGHALNDVTMLLHISEDHSHASVVSFPRDMMVPIPACPREDGEGFHSPMTSQMMNSTLTYGGLACTVLTVEALTGLTIPYAAMIEFNGVIEMSTAVGGVPVCVASPIRDHQISFYLDEGTHNLSGWDALQFLRTRYGVGDGSDLSRISNQQVFLTSLARTVKSAETLSDPVKIYGLAQAAVRNMEMSTSLQSVPTLAAIAMALKDIDLEELVFVQYPTYYGTDGQASRVYPKTSDAEKLFDAIAADQPLRVTGSLGGGAVLDPDSATTDETPGTAAPDAQTPDAGTTDPGTTDPGATGDTPAPTPGGTPGAGNAVELPDTISGTTAATHSCSAGQ